MSNATKNFDNLATSLSVLHNYFDSVQQNYFSDPAKILNLSAKPFFSCRSSERIYNYVSAKNTEMKVQKSIEKCW